MYDYDSEFSLFPWSVIAATTHISYKKSVKLTPFLTPLKNN